MSPREKYQVSTQAARAIRDSLVCSSRAEVGGSAHKSQILIFRNLQNSALPYHTQHRPMPIMFYSSKVIFLLLICCSSILAVTATQIVEGQPRVTGCNGKLTLFNGDGYQFTRYHHVDHCFGQNL